MYLRKRRVLGKSFNSGYDTSYKKHKLTDEQLLLLVKELRDGNRDVIEKIILHHLGLTIQIVSRYVSYFPFKSEDLMGVASLALVAAVNDFENKAKDNNITPYIVSKIHGEIAHFIQLDDRIIKISSYSFNELVQKAKQENKTVESLIPSCHTLEITDKTDCVYKQIRKELSTNDDQSYLHIQEIFERCSFTRKQTLVYQGLMLDKMEKDIGKELSISQQAVNKIKREIFDKLLILMLEDL